MIYSSPSVQIYFAAVALFLSQLAAPDASANLFQKRSHRSPATQVALQTQRTPFAPPSFELPYGSYQFPRQQSGPRFFSSGKPSEEKKQLIAIIRARAEHLARFGLTYKFGGNHPKEGGMDCSATMKYLVSDLGFKDMPRTSYQQYEWLKKARTIRHSKEIPASMGGRKGINPGDLIFWGGTYKSGHKVSHVMIYLGQSNNGQHYMFGARGKKKKGLTGNGVDIFELNAGRQKSLIGFGPLPGVR